MTVVIWMNSPGGTRCQHCWRLFDDIAVCGHSTRLCGTCLVIDPCVFCRAADRRAWEEEISLDNYVPPKKETV